MGGVWTCPPFAVPLGAEGVLSLAHLHPLQSLDRALGRRTPIFRRTSHIWKMGKLGFLQGTVSEMRHRCLAKGCVPSSQLTPGQPTLSHSDTELLPRWIQRHKARRGCVTQRGSEVRGRAKQKTLLRTPRSIKHLTGKSIQPWKPKLPPHLCRNSLSAHPSGSRCRHTGTDQSPGRAEHWLETHER